MIAIFLDAPVPASRLRALLAGDEPLHIHTSWEAFSNATTRAAVAVAVIEWLPNGSLPARLDRLHSTIRPRPLIVVTAEDAENARALARTTVTEILWLHELDSHLAAALRRGLADGLLSRLAAKVDGAHHLSARVRHAVRVACTVDPPIASVTDLARAIHCDRRTLTTHWRTAVGDRSNGSLKDFLGWVLLLRAHTARSRKRSWPAISHTMGVHQHTIARTERRLLGLGLRDFTRLGQTDVQDEFLSRWGPTLAILTGGTDCWKPGQFAVEKSSEGCNDR